MTTGSRTDLPAALSVRLACSPAAPIAVDDAGEVGLDVARRRIGDVLIATNGRLIDGTDRDIVALFDDPALAIATTRDVQRLVATELRDMGIYVRIGLVDVPAPAEKGPRTWVDGARQLARLAGSSETLACLRSIDGLPRFASEVLIPIDAEHMRGEYCAGVNVIYAVAWQDGSQTRMAPAAAATEPVTRVERLRLRWRGDAMTLETDTQRVTIGRGADTHITIDSDFASRHHAHIEYLHGCFVLTDHSTNGTHVHIADSDTFIHNDGVVLRAQGWISLGRRPRTTAGKLLYFWGDGAKPENGAPDAPLMRGK